MIDIPSLIDECKKKKIRIYPCHTNRASNAGLECVRRLVYERTAWDKKLLHDVGLQYLFDNGNYSEEITLKELQEAGIPVFEGQRPFAYEPVQVTGKIDCTVTQDALPLEAKSINSNDFSSISDYESVKGHKKAHIRGYVAQIQLYLFLKEKHQGLLLFRDKNSGRYKQVNVELDLSLVEDILKKFEVVNSHIAAGTLPDRVTDLTICKNCPFRAECLPDISFGNGVQLASSAYLEQLIERRASLNTAASEYDTIDTEIKELIKKQTGNAEGTVVVNGKWEAQVKKHGKGLRVDIGRLGQVATEA